MYSRNATRGLWKAHGRYVARESARHKRRVEVGFDESGNSSEIAARLDRWQSAGDQRLWKLIVSPEFGDRADLPSLTRDLMKRMERDLGTQLEWVAICHFNTDNPHVHVALRGLRDNGQPLSLDRDYVKRGIRNIAEELCTGQLGYRSELDVAEAQRREVSQRRFTSLDRVIARDADGDTRSERFIVRKSPAEARDQYVVARLKSLEEMGLAQEEAPGLWTVRRDFGTALRAMQRAADRQKALASHGVPVSDTRLPMVMADLRSLSPLEGRVLSHGEDESTGRSFMMLEGTDAHVYCLYHTPEIVEARARGRLRANSFIRLRKLFVNGRPLLEVDDLGHSERILSDRAHLEETARKLVRRDAAPVEERWEGWLGHYQKALRDVVVELQQAEKPREQPRRPYRGRGRSRGR
jgi:hypothetical protein